MFSQRKRFRYGNALRRGCAALVGLQLAFGSSYAALLQEAGPSGDRSEAARLRTRTPIKHVIVIIGENRTFDHIFATYKPKKGETVDNLLSKGIVNEDGSPGPNYWLAEQYSAFDGHLEGYQVSPGGKSIYHTLPPPLVGGPKTPLFSSIAAAQAAENGLAPEYYVYLPTGPFQLTSETLPYDSYTASPVHRFYQMWQQLDCNVLYISTLNQSGCLADLFPWVEVTVGAGTNGKSQPANFNMESTKEGSTAMAFYNVLKGDAPYLKQLADQYAMSDNY